MHFWLNIGLLLCSSTLFAAELQSEQPLVLSQVIVKILEDNPALKAGDYESRAAAARIRQARQSTPYHVNLTVENLAGSGRYKGVDSAETTLSLVRILESGNKSTLRGQVADQTANLLQNELDAKRLDLLSEASRRFIHVAVDQQRLDIAKSKLRLIKRTAGIVGQRVKVGRSPVAERRRVDIAYARAEIELEHAEHELLTSRMKLTTMWGETNADKFTVQAPLFELAKINSFDHLQVLLEENPDLIRFATKRRLAEARLNIAKARKRPDIEISGGFRYLGGTDDGALVLSASIPLGSKSRALSGIQESELMAQREPLLYEQRRLALYTSLFEIYQELLHAQTAFDTLEKRIIPQAERVLNDYEKGYRAGRYSLLELTEARQTLLDARLEIVVAAEKYHRNRIEIERLTGTDMNAGVAQ
jgi:cobalt-zinc-cadmium efflux system outer membrane protein